MVSRSRGWPPRQRDQRQPDTCINEAHFIKCPFHRNRIGFDKQITMQGFKFRIQGTGFVSLPASAASHMAAILAGATLAVTEMSPWPPARMKSMAVASSPE